MGSLRTIVPLSEIRASGTNPREDMGDIDRLAESIEATGGEPINPPVVVMDGNTYRLVDGERRFRALCRLYEDDPSHLVTVLAFEDYSEAMSAVAMLATDDKKQLTDEERARGTQTVLKLDVPEEQAAKALHTDVDGVRKARRSRKRLGERAETMSMADLLVFAQEDWTAPEMEQLMKAQESHYDTVEGCAKRIMSHRRAEERLQKMVDALGDIEFEDARRPTGWETLFTATSVKALTDELSKVEDGHEGLKAFRAPYDTHALCVCQEPEPGAESASDRAERERQEVRDALDRATAAMGDLVAEWVRALLDRDMRGAPIVAPARSAIRATVERYREKSHAERDLAGVLEAEGLELPADCDRVRLRELLVAIVDTFAVTASYSATRPCHDTWDGGLKLVWRPDQCARVADMAREMRELGAETDGENVTWLLEKCAEHRDDKED